MMAWFKQAGVDVKLEFESSYSDTEAPGGALVFRVVTTNNPLTYQHRQPGYDTSFHGLPWYAIRNTIERGGSLASEFPEKGHGILDGFPGLYNTPKYDVAKKSYSVPMQLFGDCVCHVLLLG